MISYLIPNKNDNPYLKTQINIVITLLDGSEKTQDQIANETGYEKSNISKAIKDLEKKNVIIREKEIIKDSGRTNKGDYLHNLCHLPYEVDNGFNIWKFFWYVLNLKYLKQQEVVDIYKTLQKNDKFLDVLVAIHPLLSQSPFSISAMVTLYKGYGKNINADAQIQAEKNLFKNQLKSSSFFFRTCLQHDSIEVISFFKKIYISFTQDYTFDDKDTRLANEVINLHFKLRNFAFKFCLFVDAINGDINLENVEYLKKKYDVYSKVYNR